MTRFLKPARLLRRVALGFLALILLLAAGLTVTLNYKALLAMRRIDGVEDCALPVEAFALPESVQIAALGEAAHGCDEFQALKLTVLQALIQQGFRAFALELSFGEGLALNDYIQGGPGTAKEVLAATSYPIYRTSRMAELLDWMRAYNKRAPQGESLRFYGFDMQHTAAETRCLTDACRALGLDAQPETAAALRAVQILADPNVSLDAQTALGLLEPLAKLDGALAEAAGSGADFEPARRAARVLMQAMESWRGYGEGYANYRNACMAENAAWIADREQALGGGKVLLAAHNAHIAKSWPQGVPMGQLLAERYGDAYYAAGTGFFTAEVNISTSSMVREGYERKNHFFCSADPLAWQARRFAGRQYFLDFAAVPQGGALDEQIHAVTSTGSIGEGYLWLWYLFPGSSYRTELVPARCYDGMIYVYHAAPTDARA